MPEPIICIAGYRIEIHKETGMDGTPDVVSVRDNAAAGRYEARVGDQLAILTYRRSGERITFIHTGVPAAVEGRGLAGTLARVVLKDARAALSSPPPSDAMRSTRTSSRSPSGRTIWLVNGGCTSQSQFIFAHDGGMAWTH